MNIESSTITAVFAAGISVVSAFVSLSHMRRERLNQKISTAKWTREYFADLLKWSDEAMFLLSDALHLCELAPDSGNSTKFSESRHSLRVKLSAQIDRGRWFFS